MSDPQITVLFQKESLGNLNFVKHNNSEKPSTLCAGYLKMSRLGLNF